MDAPSQPQVRRYPVHLAIAGQPVLVVGGGAVATRRAGGLVDCGAQVTVVAPVVSGALRGRPGVAVEQREYRPGEAAGYRLVVAATNDPAVNRLVRADAEGAGVWANDASSPDGGAVAVPAVLRRGPVVVSVGTGGSSPVLGAWLRDQVADLLGPEVGVLAELVAEARGHARAGAATDVVPDWRPVLDSGMLDLIRSGRILEAKERLSACRSSSSG
jgi:siroheme synthase-like protein